MPECALIINVSKLPYTFAHGPLGTFTIPERKDEEKFGLLVVYPMSEIQDTGNGSSRRRDTIDAPDLARAILGIGSEGGSQEKHGLFLCSATPDIPKALERAMREEQLFLNNNPPQVKTEMVGKMRVMVNTENDRIRSQKEKLSTAVVEARQQFETHCRTLVSAAEVKRAHGIMIAHYQQRVVRADQLWMGNENDKKEISFIDQHACRELGLERPWCYSPQQMVDCPGCGKAIKEGVIACGSCGALLDLPFEEYAKMTPQERARKLYPERYAEPVSETVAVGSQKKK